MKRFIIIILFVKLVMFPVVPIYILNESYAQTKTYKIGDRGPAGGWIFYDKGEYSGGWQYLEAAPKDLGSATWGCYNKKITGAQGTSVGKGKENTQAIVKNCKGKTAAKLCIDYRGGGKSDWFFPSIDELDCMLKNLHCQGIGGFSEYGHYWSSTEFNADSAWDIYFYHRAKSGGGKINSVYVRAIRAF